MVISERTRMLWFSLGWILFFSLSGCKRKVEVLKSPPGYDFSNMEKSVLHNDLREISGVAWDHNQNEFAAINDEKGTIFFIDKETKMIRRKLDFGPKGDYEDVAFIESIPYVLKSDGTITKLDIDSAGNTVGTTLGGLEIDGSKDFESMYYDPARKALILICKNCESDDKEKVSAFAYYLDSTGFNNTPVFSIDVEAIKKLAPKSTSRFQPSAASIHPQQQKLYLISSASNQLVVADLNGNVESVHVLAAKFFPQPEGICFKQNGDMYISNEGPTSRASLLKFAYTR